jgi:hypothetical protein
MNEQELIKSLVDISLPRFSWSKRNEYWWRFYGKMIYCVSIYDDKLQLAIKYPRYSVLKRLYAAPKDVKVDLYIQQVNLGDPNLIEKANKIHKKMMGALEEDMREPLS